MVGPGQLTGGALRRPDFREHLDHPGPLVGKVVWRRPRQLVSSPPHLDGFLHDNSEERLQVERDRPKRVRPGPTSHELELQIDEPMAERIAGVARPSDGTDKGRKGSHPRTLSAADEMHGDAR
jgi:hypothetical protein